MQTVGAYVRTVVSSGVEFLKKLPKDMELRTYLQTEPVSWTRGADTLMSVVIVKYGSHRSFKGINLMRIKKCKGL